VNSTVTEPYKKPGKLVRSATHGKKNLTITEHQTPLVEIASSPRIDRKAALEALRAIGPVRLPSRG